MFILFREKRPTKEKQDLKQRLFLYKPQPILNILVPEFNFLLLDKETLRSKLIGAVRQLRSLPKCHKD